MDTTTIAYENVGVAPDCFTKSKRGRWMRETDPKKALDAIGNKKAIFSSRGVCVGDSGRLPISYPRVHGTGGLGRAARISVGPY